MSVHWRNERPSEVVDSRLRTYSRLKRTACQPRMDREPLSDAFTWIGKTLRAANPWAPTVTMILAAILALAVYGGVCLGHGIQTGVWR
jgi:hypothetical protein